MRHCTTRTERERDRRIRTVDYDSFEARWQHERSEFEKRLREKFADTKILAQLKPEYYHKYDDIGLPFEISLLEIGEEEEYCKFINENYIIYLRNIYYHRDGFKLPTWEELIDELSFEIWEDDD